MNSFRLPVLLAVTALATMLAFFAPVVDDLRFQTTLLVLTFSGALAFFAFAPNRGHPIWASISFLFTLGYAIVNLNLPLLHVLNIDVTRNFEVFIWTNTDIFNQSVAVSSVGLLYFLVGVALATPSQQAMMPDNRYVYSSKSIPMLAVAALALFLAASGTYVLGDYSASGASNIASYFYKLFKVSMTAFVLMKVAGFLALADQVRTFRDYLRHLGMPLLLTLVPFLILTFIVGDRAPLIFFALLTFGPYWAKRNTMGLLGTVILAYAIGLVLSILGSARQARFGGGTFAERISDQIAKGSVFYAENHSFDQPVMFGQTLELASSVRVLNHVIANVPSQYDYGYGVFSMQQIASVVPGVGSLIYKMFFNGDWRMDGSANFVTYLIQGANPSYGDGTSVTAELYLDFGIYGVMLGLLLFGIAVGRNEFKLYAGPGKITFGWVFAMMYFANAIYTARSSLLLELANTIIVFLLLRFAVRRHDVRRKQPYLHAS